MCVSDDVPSLSGAGSCAGVCEDGGVTDPLVDQCWSSATLRVLSSMPSRTIGEFCACKRDLSARRPGMLFACLFYSD